MNKLKINHEDKHLVPCRIIEVNTEIILFNNFGRLDYLTSYGVGKYATFVAIRSMLRNESPSFDYRCSLSLTLLSPKLSSGF